jgi:hypothetical protein
MAFYGRLLSNSPFIMMAGTGNGMLGPAWPMQERLPEECYLLISFWTHFAPHTASNLAYELRDYQHLYPRRRFLFLANELSQLYQMQRLGLPCVMGNHNLFVDEKIFTPDNEESPDYDCIYNARMNAEKRHDLCGHLDSVAFIYYFNPRNDFHWFNRIREQLPKATFLNGDPQDNSYRHFTPIQCAARYSQARVGLCLSQAEGAMLSSMEYLLCGLPVLTTPNAGGRNHFLRTEYAIMCEADCESVRRNAMELIRRNLHRTEVRDSVMEIVRHERDRFFCDVSDWLEKHNVHLDFRQLYSSRFINRMWETYESTEEFNKKNATLMGS